MEPTTNTAKEAMQSEYQNNNFMELVAEVLQTLKINGTKQVHLAWSMGISKVRLSRILNLHDTPKPYEVAGLRAFLNRSYK